MNLFLTLMRVTAKELSRDILGLFFSFAFPLFFMIFFGALSQPDSAVPPMPVAVVSAADGEAVQAAVRELVRQPSLNVTSITEPEVAQVLRDGRVGAVIRLKADAAGHVSAELESQGPPNPYLRTAVENTLARLEHPELAQTLAPRIQAARSSQSGASPFAYVLPALLGMALLQLGLFGTATPILAARARGTLVHLTMTPLPKHLMVGAHVAVRLLIALIQLFTLLLLAKLWFKWPIDGGWWQLLAMLMLGALMLIALGALIAGIAPSELSGSYLVLLANFAMLGLGDIFFATKDIGFMAWVSMAMPVTYLSDAARQLVLGVSGRFPLWVDLAAMAGMTMLLLAASARFFQFGMKKG